MKEPRGTGPFLNEKKMQKVLERVQSHLQIRKTEVMLGFEIREIAGEVEHVKDMLAGAHKRLTKIRTSVMELEPRMVESRKNLAHLQLEKRGAKGEVAKLEDIQKDIEKKIKVLPELEAEITKVREDVATSSARLKKIETSREEMLTRREELMRGVESLRKRTSILKGEIPVLKNTRDILTEMMPEGSDVEAFQSIQDNYLKEIEKIESRIAELNIELKEQDEQEGTLLSKKRYLTRKIEEVKGSIGDGETRETLVVELNELKEQRNRLVRESTRKKKKVTRLEAANKKLDDAFKRSKKRNSDFKERLAALTFRQREMDGIDNVANEIERLEEETQRLHMDIHVHQNLLQTGNNIVEDLREMNSHLQSVFEDYDKTLVETEQEVAVLLSPYFDRVK